MTDQERIGVNTTIVGYTATEARKPMWDKDGTSGVLEIPIAHNEGYSKDGEFVRTGTTWYTVSAAGEYADQLAIIPKGSKIKVSNAKQEVREYTTKDGEARLGITLKYGVVTILETGSSDSEWGA